MIGDPVYGPGLFLGGFYAGGGNPASGVWWSSSTGLTTGTYFLFETAFAAVTLALVGVIFLKKVRFSAIAGFSVVYFLLIWDLPAAWIWNPSGWLAKMGMVDFAGGLVVHAAAGASGLGVLAQLWREERARGHRTSPQVPIRIHPGWLTLGILLSFLTMFLLARVLGGISEPVRALATDASATGGPSGPPPAPVAVDPGPVAVIPRRTP